MRSAIIVLNMNGGGMVLECLQSLASQDPSPDEIIVVDNGSEDGSDDLVAREMPGVTLLRQGRNTGFTGGNNIGFRHSDADLVVLVNNDCVAEPGWLASLQTTMADPEVGAATSSMRNIHDLSVMDSAGGDLDWLGFAWDTGKGHPASDYESLREVAFPCGGAVALRRQALPFEDRIFNDDLFIYQEDVELGMQLHRRGWKVVYDPGAVIRHVHSATTKRGSFFKEHLCNRNRLIVLRRNMDPAVFRRYVKPVLAWQLLWTTASLLRGRITLTRALLAGTRNGLRAPVEYDPVGRPLREVFCRHAVYRPGRPWRTFQSWARRTLGC